MVAGAGTPALVGILQPVVVAVGGPTSAKPLLSRLVKHSTSQLEVGELVATELLLLAAERTDPPVGFPLPPGRRHPLLPSLVEAARGERKPQPPKTFRVLAVLEGSPPVRMESQATMVIMA